jgi:hypothetical protein
MSIRQPKLGINKWSSADGLRNLQIQAGKLLCHSQKRAVELGVQSIPSSHVLFFTMKALA